MPDRLSLTGYPNLDLADAGKLPNLGYGSVEAVRTHCIAGGATALLAAGITASQTTIEVDNASRYPAAPFTIQAASERMRVTAKAGTTFTVTRGYGSTTASAHGKGRTVFEVRTGYVYLVSPEPVKAIGQVYIDGIRQTTGCTAYTGQAGDEHPDWPGRAVVAFSADAEISRQRNLGAGKTGTRQAEAIVSAASHGDLMEEAAAPVALAVKSVQKVWAAFTGAGSITSQKYEAKVKNLNASDGVLSAVIKDISTGAVIRYEKILVPSGSTKTVTLGQDGGSWATEFALMPYGLDGSFEVQYMKKTVTVVEPPEEEDFETYSPPPALTSYRGMGIEKTPTLRPEGRVLAWASYPSASQGTIDRQTHFAEVKNPGSGEARVRLVAAEASGSCLAFSELSIAAGASGAISLTHQAGGWDAMTRLVLISGEAGVDGLRKEVSYLPAAGEAEKPLATASARVVIGKDIAVDADWAVDATGDYGGTGTLIERPDRVMKHFIVKRMGFALADIDAAAFSDAGASYASAITGGYKFGFGFGEIKPSEFLRRLARECRSTVRYRKGKWELYCLPDAAPAAARTISKAELAGEHAKFTFGRTPVADLANDITARFKRNYNPAEKGGQWLDVSRVSDGDSIAKYGAYPGEFEFRAVRRKAMADDVLAHVLKQRKAPLLVVEFPVFYEHFDLASGDTVEVENPLYNGRKFYIESIKRLDKFRAAVKALEWWG